LKAFGWSNAPNDSNELISLGVQRLVAVVTLVAVSSTNVIPFKASVTSGRAKGIPA